MITTADSIRIQPHLTAIGIGCRFIVCQNRRDAGKQLTERQRSTIGLVVAEPA